MRNEKVTPLYERLSRDDDTGRKQLHLEPEDDLSRGHLAFQYGFEKAEGVSTPLGCKTALCRVSVKDAVRQGEADSLTLIWHSTTCRRKQQFFPSESARLPQAVPPPVGW